MESIILIDIRTKKIINDFITYLKLSVSIMQNRKNNTNIHVISRAIIIDQEHILLCRTSNFRDNFYFLPGGHVEHGESNRDALIRELKEETDSEIEIKRFLGCLEFSFTQNYPEYFSMCHDHEYNFCFEATSDDLSTSKKVPKIEDHIDLIWVPYKDMISIDLRPKPFIELIPKWLEMNADEDLFFSKMSS